MAGVDEGRRRQGPAIAHAVEQLLAATDDVGHHVDADDGTADDVDGEEGGDTPQSTVEDRDDDGHDDGHDRQDHHADHQPAVTSEHVTKPVHAVTFHVRSLRAGGLLNMIFYILILFLSTTCISFAVV